MLFLLNYVLASSFLSDFKIINQLKEYVHSENPSQANISHWALKFVVNHLASRLPEIKKGNIEKPTDLQNNKNTINTLDPVEYKDLIELVNLFNGLTPINASGGGDTFIRKVPCIVTKCRKNFKKFEEYMEKYPDKDELTKLLNEVEELFKV